MSAKKSDFGLIIKLLAALAIGAVVGRVANVQVMDAGGSVKYALGQIIFYAVPLVIVGFIAPAIARLGQNASRMLLTAVALAYLSSVGAAAFSALSGYLIIPHLSVPTQVENLLDLPKPSFVLDIPPLMSVMSALVTALLIGLATSWTKAETINKILNELEGIMTSVVQRVIIPLLPFFVGATFCELSYEGRLTVQLPIFLKIIGIVIIGHYIWLAVLYVIGGILSGRNPWQVVRYYLPAYLTAVGTMSSAATLPVALSCARRSPVLSRTMTEFMIPLGATVHLCGSVLTETFFVMTISLMLYGALPSVGTMALFIVLFGIFAVGAPGVPGGTVMASLGLITGVLGFDSDGTALMLAIFALQDSFGTACNVTGDGGLGPAAGDLRLAGQFRHSLQRDGRRCAGAHAGRHLQP